MASSSNLRTLEADSTDLRPEQSRWDSLLSRINNQPDPIVHAANVAGGMDKLRAAHPPAESFWWHLDSEVTRRRVRSIRQLITTLVTIVVIVVGGYWAINFFFPPNPEAVLMVETTNGIDRLVAEQRWQEALDLVKAARAQVPTQPELMVWEAVLNEQIGDMEAATAALAEAEQALASQPSSCRSIWAITAYAWEMLKARKAAGEQALTINPDEPQIYFLLGSIAETQGDLATAISYFEQTYELAEGSSPQLAVIARVRMGQLMQNPNSFTSPVATPTTAP